MGVNIMLALGSLVMFATFLGSSNKVMIGNTQLASQNEYYIAGLSYGQSVIDEAKTKTYQGWVMVGPVKTASTIIGTENAGEMIGYVDTVTATGYMSEAKYDDVDDYNGYTRRVNSPRAEGYVITARVNWVDESAPSTISVTPTKYKRMVVSVTSPYFPKIDKGGVSVPDTVKLAYVFTK